MVLVFKNKIKRNIKLKNKDTGEIVYVTDFYTDVNSLGDPVKCFCLKTIGENKINNYHVTEETLNEFFKLV